MSPPPTSPATLADLPSDIIQTHILPRLDGPSLYAAAYASSSLHSLCTEAKLWSHICTSMWPSTADPRLDHLISTFPGGRRSFFQDSFPALTTHRRRNRRLRRRPWSTWQPTSHRDRPSHRDTPELISAVDIHYQNDIVYSGVHFTDTTVDFLSPLLWVELNPRPEPGISRVIDLKVNDTDTSTLSHLKESVKLNWILIDPTLKRAGNLSSVKPIIVKKHWLTGEIHLRYVTVLPGCDPDELTQCVIEVTCVAGKGGVGLHVRGVVLHIQDLEDRCLTGKEFLVITQRAMLEENNVMRKMASGEEREGKYDEFCEMRREKKEWMMKKERKTELVFNVIRNGVFMFVMWGLAWYFIIIMNFKK